MPTSINTNPETRNSKQIRNYKLETVSNFSFRISNLFRILFFVFLICIAFSQQAFAGTDPLDATTSASATVPSLTDVSDHTAPSIPILISPPDGALTDNSSPTFTWRRSTDPNSNTVFYTLYLNGVATYSGIGSLGNTITSSYTLRLDGDTIHLTPTSALKYGPYSWSVTASDLSLNTSHSATWHFTLEPYSTTYPATITRISSLPHHLSPYIYLLLAIITLILLIILRKNRSNLILLNDQLQPLPSATIYHSRAYTPGVKGAHTPGVLSIHPLMPNDHGRLFVPHLARYSTLTVRTDTCTYILSISVSSKLYTIILG